MTEQRNKNMTPADDFERIMSLYSSWSGNGPVDVEKIAAAGSNRRYYLLTAQDGSRCVATCGDDVAENRTFIRLSQQLLDKCSLPVPEVLAVSDDCRCYLQSYAGKYSLLEYLKLPKDDAEYSADDIEILSRVMRMLAHIQYVGGKMLDFSVCHPYTEMNRRMVEWDLNYFKYCFLKPSGLEFEEDPLQDEFDSLARVLLDKDAPVGFMLRDFQSRNIMVEDGNLTVIDFQGGRRGPYEYDVASFLSQARARYPRCIKELLLEVYLEEMKRLDPLFSSDLFKERYPYFLLFRMLQTLGAYGFRGWVERKPHFLKSVTDGVENLYSLFAENEMLGQRFPYLKSLSALLRDRHGRATVEQTKHKIIPEENPLVVRVTSLSFKKGYPEDPTGNGGGFVFDCRAPHNPGRYTPYKQLTGLDEPVRKFLEEDGEIQPFIEECCRLVDSSVERYLQRGFTSLSVNFGCTGGQHRSVYSADKVARHINEKYGVEVKVCHREQNISYDLPAKETVVCFDSFLRYPQKTYSEK